MSSSSPGGMMLALAKDLNQRYQELIAAGGLANGLQMALRQKDSSASVLMRSVSAGVVCVRVEGEQRRCQAYLVEQKRLFVFDLRTRHSILVGALTESLEDAAERIHMWLAKTCSAAQVVAGLERVMVEDDGIVYSASDDIDRAWSDVPESPRLVEFKREASCREQLRVLRVYGGSHILGFSRCTRHPFTSDIPFVWPSNEGHFIVMDRTSNVLGTGDAAYAADLTVTRLPPNCGPAVSGTCESL